MPFDRKSPTSLLQPQPPRPYLSHTLLCCSLATPPVRCSAAAGSGQAAIQRPHGTVQGVRATCPGQTKAGHSKAGQGAGQGRARQGRAGQGKAGSSPSPYRGSLTTRLGPAIVGSLICLRSAQPSRCGSPARPCPKLERLLRAGPPRHATPGHARPRHAIAGK